MLRVTALFVLVALAAPLRAGDVPARVYADVNASSLTDLAQAFSGDDYPLEGILLRLTRGSEAVLLTSDADGRATFTGVADGTWLVRPVIDLAFPEPPPCTSHNLPHRLIAKLSSGDGTPLAYVALGDSSPKYGSAEGKPYPTRLAALLEAHVAGGVTLTNRADPGTVTADWLPGTYDFENARAYVAAADLITLTLGGNDMQNAVSGGSIANAPAVINQAIQNLTVILAALREVNPGADIVVTVYPNYSKADVWLEVVPANLIEMLRSAMETAVKKMRVELAGVDGILIGDVYGELAGADMNLFMADPLHVNDRGHTVYAQVIFRTLGGVVLPDDVGRERAWGFELKPKPAPPEPDAVEAAPDVAAEAAPQDEVAAELSSPPDAGRDWGGADSTATDDVREDVADETGDPATGGGGGSGGCALAAAPRAPLPFLLLSLVLGLAVRRRRA